MNTEGCEKTMTKCFDIQEKYNLPCDQKDCRRWVDFEEDLNCSVVCARKNDTGLSLRDVAERMGVTFVRIQQIEKAALKKLKKKGVFEEN
jgi:DNA-directed RNA polymerase sigma subunit (sigma70/sigma32)